MLKCTDIGETGVEASIPRSEDRRNKLAEKLILKFVAITGVPLAIDDEEIQCATGADSVRRITKRDILNRSTKIPTMAVVLVYENDAPHIGKNSTSNGCVLL